MGPPGSGKGTQSRLLAERIGASTIASGDMLRAAAKRKSPLGIEAKRHMDKGELVPDAIMIGMIEECLREKVTGGFILDGFPRTVPQGESLSRLLDVLERPLNRVIWLAVPREDLIKRLSGRRTCRECGALYHIIFDPPTNTGLCNKCNGELYQRDDDQEDIIASRLDVYERETAPLLDYYRSRGLLAEVEGTGGPDDILARTLERLGAPPA